MNVRQIAGRTGRILIYILLGVILLVAGLLGVLYSSWAQERVRVALLQHVNNLPGDTQLSLKRFNLRFPLIIEADSLALCQGGDTIIAASGARASAGLLPLLRGRIGIDYLDLTDAKYVIGTPDSAMYMTVCADTLAAQASMVALSDMDISLGRVLLSGGSVSMTLKSDSTEKSSSAQPTRMRIRASEIELHRFCYTMRMMPTIDTLRAYIPQGRIAGGDIDMMQQNIHVASFAGRGLDARYIVPDSATIAAEAPYPVAPATTESVPWTVRVDSIGFDASNALYATAGVEPVPGLDFGYIEMENVGLKLTDFYNRATTVRLPITISGVERCGVALQAAGTLDIDSVALRFDDFSIDTQRGTHVCFDGLLGMGDLSTDPSLPMALNLDGAFAPGDLADMFPAFKPIMAGIPSADDVQLRMALAGTAGSMDIDTLRLDLNRCLSLSADGHIDNMMNPTDIGGDISFDGRIINVDKFKKAMMPGTSMEIPPMTLGGYLTMRRGVADGRLSARTDAGALRLDGRWNSRQTDYSATLTADRFPVNAFMPLLGVGAVTASAKVTGHGYDIFAPATHIDADMTVNSLAYNKETYDNINAKAHVADGNASVTVSSDDRRLDFDLTAQGNLEGHVYRWQATLDGHNIDLQALGVMTEDATLELSVGADVTLGPGSNDMLAHVVIDDLFFRRHQGTVGIHDVDVHYNGTDSLTDASITARDFIAHLATPCSLDSLSVRMTRAADIVASQLSTYMIDIDTLSRTLPPFAIDVNAGPSSMINNILSPQRMSMRSMRLSVDNDSILALDGNVRGFDTGSMVVDSIYVNARQHREHLHFAAGIENRAGNLDQWHNVSLTGKGEGNKLTLNLHQNNLRGDTGYEFGVEAMANAADSTLTVHVAPYNPTIAYQPWTVNDSNFISYRIPDRHIDANLRMSGGNSSLAIYTEHQPDGHHEQEDLVINLTDIHISDWVSLNPFAPPVKGDVSADLRLNRVDDRLVGRGSAGITDFVYGRERVADFKTDFDVSATASGIIKANADLMVNGVRTITVSGALNDTISSDAMALNFSMIHFPLSTVNPFLPPGVARLSGMLNGTMEINGTTAKPIINGYLDFDSTAVRLGLTGTDYTFSHDSIPVNDNVVMLDRFTISGCNANPLTVDGTVDLTDIANAKFNLAMKARDMQIVDTRKPMKGADVYGKAFVDLDVHANGNMNFAIVDAKVGILAGTNVTYVIPDATNAITNYSNSDMVKFINFADTVMVAQADSIANTGMAMLVSAELSIENGSTINVDLSSDGKNKVQLQPNGTLDFSMSPLDEGRLTGRLNIDGGFVRYSQPPILSEKIFNFSNGSYVAFTGDMLNPTLNVHAVDVLKANVTQTGQNSRLVNFDVLLGVTGTLEHMNVAFDLATNDDMTVANELESMTPDQRANQAMNMLLYNVYTGPGTKANASLSGNPLFSFVESQVNSWAANNIKGVDISFGIDQYDRTVDGSTSSTMRYSYQVSKSLFNDRVKIVVGGNYSTDANADENFSQNLINDISFEYFLNKTRTMYLRVFRHTGYESILEGEITQTGVGFVYRRKLRRLADMFLPVALVRRREQREAGLDVTNQNQEDKTKEQ